MNYQQFFKGKRVTLMGLGLLGRGLGDAIFLAENGAELTVTDLRDEKTLAPSLAKLKKYKNIKYMLGKHNLEDFKNRDFIMKAAGVPLDSPYIAEAQKHGIPIEMDASLFAKLMPKGVTLVGVTGTRGKSTVTTLIYEILSSTKRSTLHAKRSVYKGGNLVPEATLPLLKKVKSGDIVVLELDSWQLQGFHDAKLSPRVAVFTTFLDDHLVYYKGNTVRYFEDKSAIFRYQKKGDVLIIGEQVLLTRFDLNREKGRTLLTVRASDIPASWSPQILGEHNRENIAAARAAARVLGVSDAIIKKTVERFKGVPGRLEYLRTVRGIKIFNDNNATTPDATIAGLRALSPLTKGALPSSAGGLSQPPKAAPFTKGNIILIMGGTDKVLGKHDALVEEISKSCKAAILLKETGTETLLAVSRQLLGKDFKKLSAKSYQLKATNIYVADTLQECVQKAMKLAERGDTVLFSPAFASFGKWFKNEYDRGEQFVKLIEKL